MAGSVGAGQLWSVRLASEHLVRSASEGVHKVGSMKTIHLQKDRRDCFQAFILPTERCKRKRTQGADAADKRPVFTQINMGRSGSEAPQTEEQRRSVKTHAEGRGAFPSRRSHALF